ncbi:MAG: MerC domain-containing protein [Elusimicrobia bacterium]|nr:MerC domain-containing protein [Elusimicrobiota bacterium]
MSSRACLLYFESCPNKDKARENLKQALVQLGIAPIWDEVDLESYQTPQKWRGFPSPTILVDGSDVVTGNFSASGTTSCRLGDAPSVDLIAARLKSSGPTKKWWVPLSSTPAALISLFPAAFCPACYPALAGLLSSLGLAGLISDSVLRPLTIAFLFIGVLALGYEAKRNRHYGSLAMGAVGAIGIYAGLYIFALPWLKFTGIAMLIGASIWNVFPKKFFKAKTECAACKAEGGVPNG